MSPRPSKADLPVHGQIFPHYVYDGQVRVSLSLTKSACTCKCKCRFKLKLMLYSATDNIKTYQSKHIETTHEYMKC